MQGVIRSASYEIFIGNDTFFQLGKFLTKNYSGKKIFILVDENTKTACLPFISDHVPALKEAAILEIESGEKNKSISTCEKLWTRLTEKSADRSTLLMNLGGGVIGDVGGFIASTYMRGIDFINIPTTLLSMVDASSGGKNGINFSGLKNQVGTFTKPAAVFISPSFLKTLPERELKSGFAEVIKHALIADKEKWNELKQVESFTDLNWEQLISHSVSIKNKIVNADFKERNKRKTLNFGHTVGHALESYSAKHHPDPLKHGEAILFGMIAEIFLSQKVLGFPEHEADEVISFLQKHIRHFSGNIDTDGIMELILADKKNEQRAVNFVLLSKVGEPVINQRPDVKLVREAVEFCLSQTKSTANQQG